MEGIIYREGRQSFVECVNVSVAADGQIDTFEFEARDGYDRLDGVFTNFVQHAAGEENIMDGTLQYLKLENTDILFDEEVGINDLLAVKANIPNHLRGFPTGGIEVRKGQKIKAKTTDTTPNANFAAYTRKFYFIFSKPSTK